MKRYIEFAPRGRRDVRRIMKWLLGRSLRGANSWYEAFWKTVTRVADDPESFSLADESADLPSPVRQAIFKTRKGRRYRIVFDFSDAEVYILRVRRPGERPLRERDLRSL